MTKQEYMQNLQEKLERFGQELQEEILEDYRQHFAEGENEGKSQEEIIEKLGNIENMIRELSEEDLPEEFSKRTLDPGSRTDVREGAEAEHSRDAGNTEMNRSFSYSGFYKAIILEGKAANVTIARSGDDRIHVEYEAKGVSSQLNYEYYQYEEDGTFYAGVRRKKGIREEDDSEEKLVKVTLFGRTIISYGNIGNFGGDGQSVNLTVKVPKGIPRLVIKVGSGNLNISGVELESLEGNSGSGNVVLNEVVADRLKAHTGSGNITAEHTEFISAGFDTGSGNVKAEKIKGRELKCGTGSGNIEVDSAVAEYRLATGSGSIRARAVGAVERVDLSSGSGSIRLELEGVRGMETAVRSGSGSIHVAWENEDSVKVRNGTYAYGNSECKVRVNTGSGSIRISGRQG